MASYNNLPEQVSNSLYIVSQYQTPHLKGEGEWGTVAYRKPLWATTWVALKEVLEE